MNIACLDVPAFPLQLLTRRHPEWGEHPVVVVDEDRPQGRVLWADARAFACRILPGMRYAAGLALSTELRAGVVSAEEIREEVARRLEALRRFSPGVEAARDQPGTFFLDATGLDRLYGSLAIWAVEVQSEVAAAGLLSTLAVGFTRFGVFAGARSLQVELDRRRPAPQSDHPASGFLPSGEGSTPHGGAEAPTIRLFADPGEGSTPHGGTEAPTIRLSADPAEEEAVSRALPLERLDFEPSLREALHPLGVRTLGEFLALPPTGLQTRFGARAAALHRWASGRDFDPLRPVPPPPVLWRRLLSEYPETDAHRLLFLVKRLLDPLLQRLADRHEALLEMRLVFTLEGGEKQTHRLRPAEATLDAPLLLELLRLRLESVALAAGVVELLLSVRGVTTDPEQIRLFQETPRRDLAAANRALARIRAELGEDAVRQATLREGQLPEAGFTWELMTRLSAAEPRVEPRPRVVRRILPKPVRLPPVPRNLRNEGWVPTDAALSLVDGRRAGADALARRGGVSADTLARRGGVSVNGLARHTDSVPADALARPGGGVSADALARCGGVPVNGLARHTDSVPADELARSHDRRAGGGPAEAAAAVVRLDGPYVISGGWWRTEQCREYHFAHTRGGDILWVYYDRPQRRWFLQGRVE